MAHLSITLFRIVLISYHIFPCREPGNQQQGSNSHGHVASSRCVLPRVVSAMSFLLWRMLSCPKQHAQHDENIRKINLVVLNLKIDKGCKSFGIPVTSKTVYSPMIAVWQPKLQRRFHDRPGVFHPFAHFKRKVEPWMRWKMDRRWVGSYDLFIELEMVKWTWWTCVTEILQLNGSSLEILVVDSRRLEDVGFSGETGDPGSYPDCRWIEHNIRFQIEKKIPSSSDPHPETLFWHSFWYTIWKYINLYM